MDLFKKTIKYMTHNIPRLLVLGLIPALVLTFSANLNKFFAFFINPSGVHGNFGQIYRYFSFLGSENWILGLLGIFVVSFFASLTFSAIERHMKIGKLTFGSTLSRVDESIMAVFPIYLIFVGTMELAALLNSSLIVFLSAVLPSISYYFAILITIVIYALVIAFHTSFFLWAPSMLVVGYPFKSACIYSTRIVSNAWRKIFKDFSILFFSAAIVTGVLYVFLSPHLGALVSVISFAVYMFIYIFTISYMMVTYFELSEEPRNDLRKKKKTYLT